MAYQAGKEERKWLSYTSISRTFSFWLMSTLNMAPDFREACEGWHFHTQQHLVTTHDVPSTWLLTSLSVCVRMLNALWQIWRGAYSVTKQSKPFLRKCPTIMRYILYVPLLPLICSERFSLSLSLSLSLTYTITKLGISIYSMSFTFSLSAVYAKAEFCSHTLNAILLSSQTNLSLQNGNLS